VLAFCGRSRGVGLGLLDAQGDDVNNGDPIVALDSIIQLDRTDNGDNGIADAVIGNGVWKTAGARPRPAASSSPCGVGLGLRQCGRPSRRRLLGATVGEVVEHGELTLGLLVDVEARTFLQRAQRILGRFRVVVEQHARRPPLWALHALLLNPRNDRADACPDRGGQPSGGSFVRHVGPPGDGRAQTLVNQFCDS
jgi:hypothetical protein